MTACSSHTSLLECHLRFTFKKMDFCICNIGSKDLVAKIRFCGKTFCYQVENMDSCDVINVNITL